MNAEAMTVRTRFAPSPTGYLHVGGARTALFNFLLARHCGGVFVLRIEDTDQTRNIPGAEEKLLDDLRWLGLVWDEGPQVGGPYGPYRQSERLEAYRQVARRLLDEGKAYYAFDTREELEAMRREAQRRKENFRYPRPKRFPSQAEAQAAREAGRPVVVRFAMPRQDFVIRDEILGEVTIRADELDDFVLLKSDGWPTYHFAVVIDDEHMKITHVLRGQEHLMNTANHIALQQALGYRTPAYAHLPIILNPDGSKMSKRDKDRVLRAAVREALDAGRLDKAAILSLAGLSDAQVLDDWLAGERALEADTMRRLAEGLGIELPEIDIHDFRASGYLPQVLVNFLALLGWSPADGRERMTLEELIERFDVRRIGKTNARFDRAKLLSFNTDALANLSMEHKLAAFRDYLAANPDSPLNGQPNAILARLMEICAGFRTFRELERKVRAIWLPDEQVRYDPQAVRKVLLRGDGAGLAVLREARDVLAKTEPWQAAEIERAIRGFCEQKGLGLGKVAQPIRVAVTGTTVSPSIFETLELLGREKTLRRIDRVLVSPPKG